MGMLVLVAEDEALIALSLADLLEAEGHEAVFAADGVDALAAAGRLGDAIGVLVTDLNMPRMGGEDLIRALRADRPDLPVVVVTGSAPPSGEVSASRATSGATAARGSRARATTTSKSAMSGRTAGSSRSGRSAAAVTTGTP